MSKNKKVTSIGPANVTDGEIVEKASVAETVAEVVRAAAPNAAPESDAIRAQKEQDVARMTNELKSAHGEKASLAFELMKATLTQKSTELASMRDADMDTLVSQAFVLADKFKAVVDARFTNDLKAVTESVFSPTTKVANSISENTGSLN